MRSVRRCNETSMETLHRNVNIHVLINYKHLSVPSVFQLKQYVVGIFQNPLVKAISIIINNDNSTAKYQQYNF